MKVTSGSHWAELSDEPYTWGQRNKIRDAADADSFYQSFAVALVSERTTAWSYETDPRDPASWEAVDDAFGDAVFAAALESWKVIPDPNASSAQSAPSPAARQSRTRPKA